MIHNKYPIPNSDQISAILHPLTDNFCLRSIFILLRLVLILLQTQLIETRHDPMTSLIPNLLGFMEIFTQYPSFLKLMWSLSSRSLVFWALFPSIFFVLKMIWNLSSRSFDCCTTFLAVVCTPLREFWKVLELYGSSDIVCVWC